jgi:hypothetical protein
MPPTATRPSTDRRPARGARRHRPIAAPPLSPNADPRFTSQRELVMWSLIAVPDTDAERSRERPTRDGRTTL